MTRLADFGFVHAPGMDNTKGYLGCLVSRLATAAKTRGMLSAYEVRVRKGVEPPPHIHTLEDEAYIILEGRWRFLQGDVWRPAGPGAFVWLPRGVQHAFEVDADGARAFILSLPGGFLECMFEPYAYNVSTLDFLPPLPEDADFAAMVALDERLGVVYPPAQGQA